MRGEHPGCVQHKDRAHSATSHLLSARTNRKLTHLPPPPYPQQRMKADVPAPRLPFIKSTPVPLQQTGTPAHVQGQPLHCTPDCTPKHANTTAMLCSASSCGVGSTPHSCPLRVGTSSPYDCPSPTQAIGGLPRQSIHLSQANF